MNHRGHISGRLLLTALAILSALSCAKISAPSGGPRDEDPPVILKRQPEDGTKMFSGNSFTVTFDEYVVLDRINEKFMVSPPLATKPDIRLKGKSMVVRWDEVLSDSTTYTFYFQDAIRDNNENNPIPNFQYVFSTGPVLDSLSLTGNVFDASTLETVGDMTVIMHASLADSAPRKLLPAYISRPDPSGGFTINNIRPGRYRLFALKDLNGNMRYDLDDEVFAFCDTIIEITPEENYGLLPDTLDYRQPTAPPASPPDRFVYGIHRLYAFTRAPHKQYLKFTERRSAWSVGFGLALPSDSGQVTVELPDAGSDSWFIEQNAARDTFMIWITDPEIYNLDRLGVILTYPNTDSTGTIMPKTDTLSFRYIRPTAPRGGPAKAPALGVSSNLAGRIRPGTVPVFRSPSPLADPDTSLIRLRHTVDSVTVELPYEFMRDTLSSLRLTMKARLEPGKSYSLLCNRGAFSDIYGQKSDSVMYRFSVGSEDEYGSISAILKGYEGSVIVQLLNEREQPVRESAVEAPGTVSFPLLDKGSYRMKVIYDLNGDGRWTTGDYDLARLPEPVSYYPAALEVKVNWSLEQDWDIGVMNVKDVSLRNRPTTKNR